METRIGVIYTPDNANDRDFWRWCPSDATLLFTRTTIDPSWLEPSDPSAEHEEWVPTDQELIDAMRTLVLVEPEVVTYACTSGSFCGPVENEARIRKTIEGAGAKRALTTSGSVIDALEALGATRVAVGTPYDPTTTNALGRFLEQWGFDVRSLEYDYVPGRLETDLTVEQVNDLATRADRPDADVLFLSCTALQTFDLIPELERRLSKSVITSSQVTMWAAVGAAGLRQVDAPQTLLSKSWSPSKRQPATAAVGAA